jgi:hypothetical protein
MSIISNCSNSRKYLFLVILKPKSVVFPLIFSNTKTNTICLNICFQIYLVKIQDNIKLREVKIADWRRRGVRRFDRYFVAVSQYLIPRKMGGAEEVVTSEREESIARNGEACQERSVVNGEARVEERELHWGTC